MYPKYFCFINLSKTLDYNFAGPNMHVLHSTNKDDLTAGLVNNDLVIIIVGMNR